MNWSTKRRLVYASATVFVVAAVLVYTFRETIFPAPTCFDSKKNGYESGVDCGGTCSLKCEAETTPLVVKWSMAVPVGKNLYDIVAMVSNKNIDNAPKGLGYTFLLYNAGGALILSTTGTTLVPVDGDFPIIKQNVALTAKPKQVNTLLFDGPHFAAAERSTSPTIIVSNTHYEAGVPPRVYAALTNTKRTVISNLQVRAVLYDGNDNAYAVGQSIIPRLDKEESKEVSFLWSEPLPQAPTKIRIYPILDSFVGVTQ
jgi:hypothetical protein